MAHPEKYFMYACFPDFIFKSGDFIGSQKGFKDNLKTNPNDLKSLIHLGYTYLLFNQLDESLICFNRAKEIKPNLSTLNYFMSKIHHRQLQFSKAAPFYRSSNREAMAKKMDYFTNVQPYQMDKGFNETMIGFIVTDPLPVVEVMINYDCKGYFIDFDSMKFVVSK